jgi:spermidine synthase
VKNYIYEPICAGLIKRWDLYKIDLHCKSNYQEIVIADTVEGKALFCNNEKQSSELSQELYHEGLTYPAALMTELINSVLIIGSSEGVVAHIVQNLGAKEIFHVDIDIKCIDACSKYLPYGYSPSEIKRYLESKEGIQLIINDAYSFVESCLNKKNKFDLIIIDLPDENLSQSCQHNRLYQKTFFNKLYQLLSKKGVIVTQAGPSIKGQNMRLKKYWNLFDEVFKSKVFFEIDEYSWTWLIGTNFSCNNPTRRMQNNLAKIKKKPKYIDSISIVKSCIPPLYLRNGCD